MNYYYLQDVITFSCTSVPIYQKDVIYFLKMILCDYLKRSQCDICEGVFIVVYTKNRKATNTPFTVIFLLSLLLPSISNYIYNILSRARKPPRAPDSNKTSILLRQGEPGTSQYLCAFGIIGIQTLSLFTVTRTDLCDVMCCCTTQCNICMGPHI